MTLSTLKTRLDRIEAKLKVVNDSTPLSDKDIDALGFNPDDAPSLQEFQRYCLNAMENGGVSIYDDVDYSQKFAEPEIPDDAIQAITEQALPDDAILMQSVVHPQSWIGGEPRTSDEYDYDY